ncbi:MAG: hypothetical protein ACP5ID_02875 [Conexivisphaera sp.]
MSNQYLVWGSKEQEYTAVAIEQAIDAIISELTNEVGGDVQVRPIWYTDLNSSATADPFIGYTASAGANAIVSNFKVQSGFAYAFYGLRDLTPGTKYISGIQMNYQGVNKPLSPLPLYEAWVDERNTAYFSPLKALKQNTTLTINLFSTAAATVSFQLIGLLGQAQSR